MIVCFQFDIADISWGKSPTYVLFEQAEEQLAEKKKEEEAQVALKDKATQNALKKAEEKIIEQQTEPGSIWTKVAETETAVNSNNDVRVASAAAQHPERISNTTKSFRHDLLVKA